MNWWFVVFEPEEIVVRNDEILRWESLEDGERINASRFAEKPSANARCRVHTKTTGWFYTSLDYVTVLEKVAGGL